MRKLTTFLLLFIAGIAVADDRTLSASQAKTLGLSSDQLLAIERAATNRRIAQATKDFQGFKLGLGFGISNNIGYSRVETAASSIRRCA